MTQLRVFLSSPGDVAEERALARQLLKDLPSEPLIRSHRITFDVYSWDDPAAPIPMTADQSPQANVNRFGCKPSKCDIVIVILWSRLGTHLDLSAFGEKPGGGPYRSGTEWEYEDAWNAQPQPDILVYRRMEEPKIGVRDLQRDEKFRQYDLVEHFFERFKNPDGSSRGGFTPYNTPEEFKQRLANDLKYLLDERLRTSRTEAGAALALRAGRIDYLGSMPKLPERYQPRAEVFEELRSRLTTSGPGGIGISGAIQAGGLFGMGGIGKTILATALAQDETIRSAFPGGIVWLTFGRDVNVMVKQAELAIALTGVSPAFRDAYEGRGQLNLLTQQLRTPLLVVLDDVWQPEVADGFAGFAPLCRIMVTTRNRAVLERLEAQEYEIGLLTPTEAETFLAEAAGMEVGDLPPESAEVLKHCGRLPLALAAVGALIRKRTFSWPDVIEALRDAVLDCLDTPWQPDREQSNLAIVLKVSVDALSDQTRACFFDFAAIREDVAVPEATLVRLWSLAAGGKLRAKKMAQDLVDRSLLRRDEERRYLIHDLYYDYLRQIAAPLEDRHTKLVEQYRTACPDGWPSGPDDGYFFQNLLWHLHQLARTEEIRSLLFDPAWLRRKLDIAGLGELILDYGYLPNDAEAAQVAGALRLSAHVLTQVPDPDQLCAQLCGRLVQEDGLSITTLLSRARQCITSEVMIPRLDGFLDHPGALVRIFEGHSGPVNAVAVLPDGRRALSGSWDATLRLWDLDTGQTLRVLEGHSDRVTAVVVLPDGRRVLSGSDDKTLRLWDLNTGQTLRVFEGRSGSVYAVAVLPDGRRALSGSRDTTLRLWDLDTGQALRVFEAHSSPVRTVAVLPDGCRALSGSGDKTLRLWDLDTGQTLRVLEGRSGSVYAVAVLPGGRRALSGNYDGTLRLWDLDTGQALRVLEGHSGSVYAVVVLPDGCRALSGSGDKTLRLWDLDTGQALRVFEGHSDWVTAVAVLPNGRRALSGSWDTTLRLWDLDTGQTLRVLEGHSDLVTAVVVLPDGRRVLSGSDDKTLRLWDLDTGGEISWFVDDHTIKSCVVSPNSQAIIVGNARGRLLIFDTPSPST